MFSLNMIKRFRKTHKDGPNSGDNSAAVSSMQNPENNNHYGSSPESPVMTNKSS
jgi:hypothetical protein